MGSSKAWPDWNNPEIVLYHGTLQEHTQTIRANGVDTSLGRPNTDFGRGFYTTTRLAQAEEWAETLGSDQEKLTGYCSSESTDWHCGLSDHWASFGALTTQLITGASSLTAATRTSGTPKRTGIMMWFMDRLPALGLELAIQKFCPTLTRSAFTVRRPRRLLRSRYCKIEVRK